MKKKLRCLLTRFVALVAALMLCASLCVPCFATNSVADMPTDDDFRAHPHSWYVWRTVDTTYFTFYELICSPIEFSPDGFLSPSLGTSFSNSLYDVSYLAGSDGLSYSYACATPVPIKAYASAWSVLPSFPVSSGQPTFASSVHFYPVSGTDLSDLYYYVVPLLSSSNNSVDFSVSSGSSSDTVTSVLLDSPLLSYPFAYRSYTSSSSQGYNLVGGSQKFSSSKTVFNATFTDLNTSYYLSHYDSLSPYPWGYVVPSSELGVVFVRKPSSSYVTAASSYSATVKGVFTLTMTDALLGDVEVGTWLSADDLQNLQDQLVNDFDVNSGTLKNSKDNLNSWNSTSSVDSDVASGASGLLGGLFQNLGTFLFSVSLLCFGAVVLRMLIRKAVDG